MGNAALVTVYNARTYPESMHATTERTAATQWRKSAGLTPTASPSVHRCTKCIIISIKAARERKREESAVMGCTRQCLSAVSSSGIRMHTRSPDWRERSLLSVSLFFFRAPFFLPSRRLLFQSTHPLPSLHDRRECTSSFSPLPLPMCVPSSRQNPSLCWDNRHREIL